MTTTIKNSSSSRRPAAMTVGNAARIAAACAITLTLAACKHGDDGTRVAGWALTAPDQRHPIIVTQQPANLNLRVARGSSGLSPQQRAQLIDFAEKFRAGDGGNSRLVITVPSGSPNEVAAANAVGEIRALLTDRGFGETSISVEAYTEEHDVSAPIRVSYLRYVAEGPSCGQFPTNLARQNDNMPYEDFGCANQRNFAAMVANPADLVEPRSETARPHARRQNQWEKYVKGETTGAQKADDERARTKNTN